MKWKVCLSSILVLFVFAAMSSPATAGMVLSGGGDGGGDGGGGGPTPSSNWNVWSTTSATDFGRYASAGIAGSNMGNPEQVYSSLSWFYNSGPKPSLNFWVNIYADGEVESPKGEDQLPVSGGLNTTHVTVNDEGELFEIIFDETFSLDWNGNYSSYGGYGSLTGSLDIFGEAVITPDPQLDFYDMEPGSPPIFPGYSANLRFFGYVPQEEYSARRLVPEPATAALLGMGALTLVRRRRRVSAKRNKVA